MRELVLPLAEVAAILVGFSAVGAIAVRRLAPPGPERAAWGFAAGLVLIALPVPLAFLVGVRPGWPAHLVVGILAAAVGWRSAGRASASGAPPILGMGWTTTVAVAGLLAAVGVIAFAVRALTEPMWSNDFLAIWGLKGKIIFETEGIPARLVRDPSLFFSHPEYPLGVPFLYAGLAALVGRFDDHAMALLFPFLQVATLGLLWGWLRRHGVAPAVAGAATALLALFAPLYAAFHVGLADIPLSFALLLLGTALGDSLEARDSETLARVAGVSGFAAGIKNEALMAISVCVLLALTWTGAPRRRRFAVAAAVAGPASAVALAHWLWRGSVPLKDFDFGLLEPGRWSELPGRLRLVVAAASEVALPAWPILAAVAVLFACGRPVARGDRLLALAAACAAVYVFLPSLGVYPGQPVLGPAFLIATSLSRTAAALAPLVAAGLAARLGDAAGPAAGPR